MNRVDRLLALILLLQSQRVTTAEQMARHFDLSLRTIYRDLAALGEAGVPIMAQAGVGYCLAGGYLLPPVNFTAEEAGALVTGAVLLAQASDASLNRPMRTALRKVRAVLPRSEQDRMTKLATGLTTTANPMAPERGADLPSLQQALSECRVLHFLYHKAGAAEPMPRTVEPLGLIHYLGRWHLIAWCRLRGDYRDFRTDRMSHVRLLGERFVPRPDYSVTDYLRSLPKPELRASVEFTPLAADRAKREWWLGIADESVSEGGVVLDLLTVGWPGLAEWLLSFGCAARVKAPAELRLLVAATAREVADHHEKMWKSADIGLSVTDA